MPEHPCLSFLGVCVFVRVFSSSVEHRAARNVGIQVYSHRRLFLCHRDWTQFPVRKRGERSRHVHPLKGPTTITASML